MAVIVTYHHDTVVDQYVLEGVELSCEKGRFDLQVQRGIIACSADELLARARASTYGEVELVLLCPLLYEDKWK